MTSREEETLKVVKRERERNGARQVCESLERRREAWGVVRRAGALLTSSPAHWRLSKEPPGP